VNFETPAEALAFFDTKKAAFIAVFNTPHGKQVLDDLMPFCRARETCVVPGDRDKTYVLEGRREVYLRIRDYLDRTPEELTAMFTKPLETRRQGDE
jgi:hypothetical protein